MATRVDHDRPPEGGKAIKRLWWALGLLPLLAFAWWGPDLRVKLSEPADRENLRKLGTAVALYQADHEGQYPRFDGSEVNVVTVNGSLQAGNPLAPYLPSGLGLLSPTTGVPYGFRFVRVTKRKNPRDPAVPIEERQPVAPDPNAVIATSGYPEGWRRGWIRSSFTYAEGQPLRGRWLVLRGDGRTEWLNASTLRQSTYDGETGKWGSVVPATSGTPDMKPWSNPPWLVFPGEHWTPGENNHG